MGSFADGIGDGFNTMFKLGCGIIVALGLAVIGLVIYICVR
jgi:hypothetical protein